MTPFRSEAVRVVVPASSANLGPAFDCGGLALDVCDEYVAVVSNDAGVLIEVSGEGAGEVPLDESHLVARSMALAFTAMDVQPAGFVLRCRNAIPHGRGMGSSAAAIIGGLVLARAMVSDGPAVLTDDDLLQLALRIESHPDNIAAALYGGLNFSWLSESGQAGTVKLDVHPEVVPVLAIPGDAVPTSKARTELPAQVLALPRPHEASRIGALADPAWRVIECAVAHHGAREVPGDPTRLRRG